MFKKYHKMLVVCGIGMLFCFSGVLAEEKSGLNILLSENAIYTIRSYGFCYRGQILDGTNTQTTKSGYVETYFVQGTDDGDDLIDNSLSWNNSIRTWLWGQQRKKVEVVFDLGGRSKIDSVNAVAIRNDKGYVINDLTVYLSDNPGRGWKEIKKVENLSLLLDKGKQPATYSFDVKDINESARYVKLLFYSSRSGAMVIGEVKIYGSSLEESKLKGKRGLIKINERPAPASLVKLPEISPKSLLLTNNKGRKKGTGLPVTYKLSSKHSRKEDNSAAESDPQKNKLIDGDYGTAVVVTKGNKLYIRKEATVIFDLKDTFKIERVIVWSAGHCKPIGSFINSYNIAASLTGEPGSWSVVQSKIVNPLWPGEAPPAATSFLTTQTQKIEYPIVSPLLDKTVRFVRIDFFQNSHSGRSMQIGEVEIWGKQNSK